MPWLEAVPLLEAVPGSNGGIAVASLTLLLFAPVLLLGADYLFDELLNVREELRTATHYRAFLYLAVVAISLMVILQSRGAGSYLEAFQVTTTSLFWILSALLSSFLFGKWVLRHSWLAREKKRIELIDLELPQYLEMFHILITSGMSVLSALKVLSQGETSPSPNGSLRRDVSSDVNRDLNGDLSLDLSKHSNEALKKSRKKVPSSNFLEVRSKSRSEMKQIIRGVLAGVEEGMAIERALDQAVMRARSEQLRRFTDAVILGMERGNSMGQTLRNLITETRNQSKVLIMQKAGKAEIQLLIPVVFLILPISVMFAIWPSYVNLASIMGG